MFTTRPLSALIRSASIKSASIKIPLIRSASGSTALNSSYLQQPESRPDIPTIYALSTAPGKAAVAIIRISGPLTKYIFKKLTNDCSEPTSRIAHLVKLYKPIDPTQLLDHALSLFFKNPHSYTGEDVLELHLHGGPAVIKAVLDSIKQLNSLTTPIRYAEAGEFTKRAFHNAKLDLTQVEGIRDIIDAETERQREAAVLTAGGQAKILYDKWRHAIVHNTALLTALIDFADDNTDIEASSNNILNDAKTDINRLLIEIESYLNKIQTSELIRSGIKMNFLGPPNAGKSSLLNLIAQRDASIVSDIPGTTRDILEVGMNIGGYKIVLGDTAGLRKLRGDDPMEKIEAEGIRRAKDRFRVGDVVLAVIPVDSNQDDIDETRKEISNLAKRTIVVINKIDLSDSKDKSILEHFSTLLQLPVENIVLASCKTGQGIQNLMQLITDICKDLTLLPDGSLPIGASQRVQDLLESDVISGLRNFEVCIEDNDIVLALAELQLAIDGIGKITGRGVGVEEILGVVFGNFCIGK